MKAHLSFLLVLLALSVSAEDQTAQQLIETSDIKGGVVVHLGQVGELTARLASSERFLVHGLNTDEREVVKAREHLRSLGLYGRASVDRFDGSELPYRDNLINLLVIDSKSKVSAREVVRVLAPRGVALMAAEVKPQFSDLDLKKMEDWFKFVKPVPPAIDDWTHYLYDATNNAVSKDRTVGVPGQLQWKGGPEWARHHDHMASTVAMVSAAGRLFYIMDEGPISSIQLPARWVLVARDAFNGKILWQRKIDNWWPHIWPNKKGFAMSARRLVADAQTVYCTLGLNAPVTALDAETGAIKRSYPATQVAEELLLSDGTLFVVVTDRVKQPDDRTPMLLRQRAENWPRDRTRTRIKAINKDSGTELWTQKYSVLQMTLAADAKRVYFHDGERLVGLERKTGALTWKSDPIPRAPDRFSSWFGATLVVHEDVVLFAGGEKVASHRGGQDTMTAVSAKDGKTLWTAPHPPSGYDSPEDLFVIDGLAWCAPLTSKKHSGLFTGHDLKTGKIKRKFPDTTGIHMPHHRCHRAKATEKYILTSRTGIEFVDIRGKEKRSRNDWVRGGCLYGIMPANGLIYTPPHACACYVLAKLSGLCALAPVNDEMIPARSKEDTLPEKGPAYSEAPGARDGSKEDWPMYRHDPARSGSTTTRVPPDVGLVWETKLGGSLTAPVIAEGKCFVASKDTHTVNALNAETGNVSWRFTAGGRVDSPPSVKDGRVVFGSSDGCVYCLRAADGVLIWRFRAAPQDRRMVAYDQLESLWPVHGSVLIHKNEVHCTAGRSMFLKGGIRYIRLDLKTGKLIAEHVMDDRHPNSKKRLDDGIRWPNLPTANQDLLIHDGRNAYMRTQAFDGEGKKVPANFKLKPHLFSSIGLLDDTWLHRSYWIYGTSMLGGASGWPRTGQKAPAGRILVFDQNNVYGFRRNKGHFSALAVTTWMEYHLFAMKKAPALGKVRINEPKPLGRNRTVPTPKEQWSSKVPMLARAMVLTPERLFVAGLPDVLDEKSLNDNLNDQALRAKATEQSEAWLGHKGGVLLVVSPADGKTVAEHPLDTPPVFDGMAAANRRLFICLGDGRAVCLGK